MILMVGLGNIGRQYKDTPHNAGFEFVNRLRQKLIDLNFEATLWKNDKIFEADICKIKKNDEVEIILFKPTTFMNLSGRAVKKYLSKNNIDLIAIAHDDLDISLGQYKVQVGTSPKCHNGVDSIDNINGSENFLRIRIGVDNRKEDGPIPGDIYVIKKMKEESINKLINVLDLAIVETISYYKIV